jgi:formamidopyrimidine-DNA glycosylase
VPELPEVETYRQVAEGAVGRTITGVDSPDTWFLKAGTTPEDLEDVLVGASFTAARRIGKLLLLDVAARPGSGVGAPTPVVGIRFGMTGTLLVDGTDGVGPLRYGPSRRDPAWERWRVALDGGGTLVVHDPRRLGGVTLDPDTSDLGPDALLVGGAALRRALAGSSAPLKARLLDQSQVAGIGNLIADETLWRAGLSPLRTAGSLEAAEVRRLHRHLRAALADLMERGGSHRGDLIDERHVGGVCPKDGASLRRATVGGRTTWWCPAHQA